MQTTATVGLVKVNNCLFDSIGGYGIVNNANANSRIENIVLSNSTIAHADKLLVCGQAKSVNSIAISNITTYFAPMTAGYFLDYNTNDVPGGVTIMNSVFGPGFTGSLVTPVAMASVNGTRFAATTTPTFINCYKTSDLTWTMKADLITPNAPITALVDLALPSTTVFAGAATSNFKVTDSRLVKLIGDPRWW